MIRFALILTLLATPLLAQTPDQDRVRELADEITTLMEAMEERAAEYPEVLERLRAGEAAIEEADASVEQLIQQLTDMTGAMEDGTEFDQAIDGYVEQTEALIAEATASNNAAIRELIPSLEADRERLTAEDERRAEAVIRARNVIRELETNREAIAFFIKAGEVAKAAELISANVQEFEDIVARGQLVAQGLIEVSNP
ncbi:MAG: hypothetical protein ACU0CI_08955 [Shimia sp.]